LFEAEGALTVDHSCEVVTYGQAVTASNPRWVHHGRYSKPNSGRIYIPLSGSSSIEDSGPDQNNRFEMLRSGRLVSVDIAHTNTSPGGISGMDVEFHRNSFGGLGFEAKVSGGMPTANVGVHFDFEGEADRGWSAGDFVSITFDPTGDDHDDVSFFVQFEMDRV
jgi:hypothetical protein